MKRKILSVILITVLMVSMIPLQAAAAKRSYGDVPILTGYADVDYMAEQVLSKIDTKGKSAKDQIAAVYDWIIKHCKRDNWNGTYYFDQTKVATKAASYEKKINNALLNHEAVLRSELEATYGGNSLFAVDSTYCVAVYAYEMLLKRTGNCLHFSSLLTVLLGQLGFDCRVIEGSFKNNDGSVVMHKWNYVLVNGKYYWLDVRIDHASYRGGKVPHKFFMKSDTKAWAKNHVWNHSYSNKLAANAKKIQKNYESLYTHKHSYSNTCDEYCDHCYGQRSNAHQYKVLTKATQKKNGTVDPNCTLCWKTADSNVIKRIKSIKLSQTTYVCDGKVKTPAVTVTDSAGNVLKKNTDYTVSYESGRKAPGKYTVKITFKGKYSGTRVLHFTITPRKVSKITATQTTSTITLKWNKVTGAYGYRVYQYNYTAKKFKAIADVRGTSLKVSKLKAGTTHKFLIRAFDKDEGFIWADYSKTFITATRPAAPALKVSSPSKGTVRLNWTNVSGESGYQVYYSTSKNGTYKNLGSFKTNVIKGTKKLTGKKTYFFKVRAYRKTASGTVCSAWSTPKSVRIK